MNPYQQDLINDIMSFNKNLICYSLFILILACDNSVTEIQDVNNIHTTFIDDYYTQSYFRNEYPIECMITKGETVRIHYNERMGNDYTYFIEKIPDQSILNTNEYKKYLSISGQDDFQTKGTILSDFQNEKLKYKWSEIIDYLTSTNLKKLEDHRDQKWLGNLHYYFLEVNLENHQFTLVHEPKIGEDSILSTLVTMIEEF
ncbi:MAG: hypothetical protein AAFP82_17185 [Bacteroidota bacterium]